MRRCITVGVTSLALAACGGGGDSAPTTTPVPPATDVADSTAPTTSSTTSTTTTTPTTTLPETTTTLATEDLIKQAVQEYIAAYQSCGEAPPECAPEEFTATQGPSRAIVSEFAEGLVARGLYFATDRRGSYLVAESVTLESPTEATTIYCVYDAGIVMGPNGPDGLPTVVNDVIASVRYTYRLFLEDGAWRVGEQHQLERLGEGSLCPPAE